MNREQLIKSGINHTTLKGFYDCKVFEEDSDMKRLFEVDLKDYDGCSKVFRRPSARAIIIKRDKIALVYATNEKYYKFPGGGIHEDEDIRDALIREVKEEVGLSVIPASIIEFGSVLRRQKSDRDDDTVFEQENYYFFCEVKDEAGDQNLDEYEKNMVNRKKSCKIFYQFQEMK